MVENLDDKQKDDLIRFFVYTMGIDQRGRLMAELPTIYAKMYPDVNPEIIVQKVRMRIAANRAGFDLDIEDFLVPRRAIT